MSPDTAYSPIQVVGVTHMNVMLPTDVSILTVNEAGLNPYLCVHIGSLEFDEMSPPPDAHEEVVALIKKYGYLWAEHAPAEWHTPRNED